MAHPESEPMTDDALQTLTGFIPTFAVPTFSAGEMKCPEGQFPYVAYSNDAKRFTRALDLTNFYYNFNWIEWRDQEGKEYVKDPSKVATASLVTIRQLFTYMMRQDRFCEGFILQLFDTGLVLAALKRLAEIKDEKEKV